MVESYYAPKLEVNYSPQCIFSQQSINCFLNNKLTMSKSPKKNTTAISDGTETLLLHGNNGKSPSNSPDIQNNISNLATGVNNEYPQTVRNTLETLNMTSQTINQQSSDFAITLTKPKLKKRNETCKFVPSGHFFTKLG